MDLRRLILVLTLCSALIPFAHTFYAGHAIQRQQLIDTTLEANEAYAHKLAQSTEEFLQLAQQQLAYTAQRVSTQMDHAPALAEEAARLRLQTKSFNSVTIYNPQGTVLSTSPETLQIQGKTLRSEAVQESIATQKPVISQPYMSTAGNLIIFISHPIITATGQYLGAVGGSIYLQQESILDHLLGSHFYTDGSYLYVVNKDRRILYHPDSQRVGKAVQDNAAIEELVAGRSGHMAITNSRGIAMLAGYALVPSTGWGIVAQRPQAATLAPVDALVRNMLYQTLPMGAAMLLFIWWGARRISLPLRQLANGAHTMDQPGTAQAIQSVHSWYYEAQELKKAMLVGLGLLQKNISKLRQDVHTDPLTDLGNRRHLDATLASYAAHGTPFSVVVIDIDHFKKVNDTYGHDVGDLVLRQLALQMREASRTDDVPCRVGGEEFVMLLPHAPRRVAAQVAERLRALVEITEWPHVGRITISLGISSWPDGSAEQATVFKQADEMLYAAKHRGRNRVEVFGLPSAGESEAADSASPALAPAAQDAQPH